ncbi:MAG: Uma2 family endonuclease [Aquificales bacterium]|nr:Uma2 family endonuclease [Aquificales bacterium]
MGTQTIARPKSESTAVAPPPKKLITGEEFFRMPNMGSAELIAGEIVTQMPTGHPHGFIENIIGALLYIYLKTNQIGRALTGEVGIYTKRNPDHIRAADVAFISHERLAQAQEEGFLDVAPELVVEIMSPANTWTEAQEKLAEYFAIDVKIVWIVDPQLEQVHVYHSPEQMKLLRKQDELTGEDVLPGFTIALTEIFDAE